MFSMAIELIHSPPDLITSLLRSVMVRTPNSSRVPTSPESQRAHLLKGSAAPAAALCSSNHRNMMRSSPYDVKQQQKQSRAA